jgi:hypothetical protein
MNINPGLTAPTSTGLLFAAPAYANHQWTRSLKAPQAHSTHKKRPRAACYRRGLLDFVLSTYDQRAKSSRAPPQGFFVIVRFFVVMNMNSTLPDVGRQVKSPYRTRTSKQR